MEALGNVVNKILNPLSQTARLPSPALLLTDSVILAKLWILPALPSPTYKMRWRQQREPHGIFVSEYMLCT